MHEERLRVEALLHASVSEVWRAWTEAEALCGWDPDRLDGAIAEGERAVLHWDSIGVSLMLDVIRKKEEKTLHLRTQRPGRGVIDLVLDLEACDAGQTRVVLAISGPMSEDERAGTAAGWHTQLRILDRYLSMPEETRQSFAALGPAVTTIARAYDAFIRPGTWLSANELVLGPEGQSYSLTTFEGVELSGEVLAHVEGRALALWCEELKGIVRFRAIPLAGGRARLAGVQVVRWGECSLAARIQESLRKSVDRLIAQIGGQVGHA